MRNLHWERWRFLAFVCTVGVGVTVLLCCVGAIYLMLFLASLFAVVVSIVLVANDPPASGSEFNLGVEVFVVSMGRVPAVIVDENRYGWFVRLRDGRKLYVRELELEKRAKNRAVEHGEVSCG